MKAAILIFIENNKFPRFHAVRTSAPAHQKGVGICGALVLAPCALTLAGWLWQVPILTTWVPGWPAMKAVTAIGMLMADFSLVALAMSRWPQWRRWRRALEVLGRTLAWGLLLLVGWLIARIVGAHGVPSEATMQAGGVWSALPAPGTVASLLAFSLALLTARVPRAFPLFCGWIGIAGALSWLGLISLTYGRTPDVSNRFFGTVSLPSAVVMLVLCGGLALLRPHEGLVRIVLSRRPAGRLVRQLLPLALLLTFVFGLVRLLAQHQWGFSTEFGTAFYSTITLVILVLVIMRNALINEKSERLRERSERRTVQSLKETQRALVHARAFLEAAPGGMIVVGSRGKIILVNSQMLSMFGYGTNEMKGQDLEMLVPDLLQALDVKDRQVFFQNPAAYHTEGALELQAHRKDGTLFDAEVSLRPLESSEGVLMIGSIRDISKRRIAERTLEERERRFRGIFNNTFQFIGLLTPEGILLETNEPSLTGPGLQASDVLGNYFWDCPWWTHSEELQERLKQGVKQAATGEVVRFRSWYPDADGNRREVDFSLKPVKDEAGTVVFLVPEGRDITDMVYRQRRQLAKERDYQQEIEMNQKRLQLATQAGGIGIWDWDVTNDRLIWDAQMYQVYQVPESEKILSSEDWKGRLHPDDRTSVVALLQETIAGGREYETVFRIVWPDGSTHYIQTKASVQRDDNGQAVRMLGTNTDITGRVMAEAGLLESEERFRHAFEYSAVGFALLDPDGTWLAVNKAICDIVGYTEEELKRLTFQHITHPADLDVDMENVDKLLRGEITHYQMEKRYVRKDGDTVWVLLTASLVKESDGSPAYFISQVEDITQRHEADLVLQHQQDQLRMFIEHTPAAVAMFDMEVRYVAASRRWVDDYKLHAGNLIGRSHYEVFPEIGEDWKAIHSRCLAGSVEYRDEDMFVREDGHEEWLRWEVRPWFDVTGEIGGIVMFTEVITERKLAAEKIRESLEEKEVLLREIHHRVKNNMQIISSLLQLQTSALHDPADVAIFQDCQARIHAMAMVHDRLYRSGNLSTINFGDHLRELAALMMRGQASHGRHIRLDTQCDDVELDLDKAIPLGLIATELVTNAYKHAFKDRTEGSIQILLQRTGESQMTLRVSDDGQGMPTASNPGTARTLGLRLVRSLSHQLRARLLFPQEGGGCCVEIIFGV